MSISELSTFVVETLDSCGKRKNKYYERMGMRLTPLWEGSTGGLNDNSMGFFSPVNAIEDARLQIRAPFISALICSSLTLNSAWACASYTLMGVLNLVLLDFDTSFDAFKGAAINLIETCFYTLNAIADTIQATLSLVTRTLASLFYGALMLGVAVVGLFSSAKESVEEPIKSTAASVVLM